MLLPILPVLLMNVRRVYHRKLLQFIGIDARGCEYEVFVQGLVDLGVLALLGQFDMLNLQWL